MPPPSPSRPRRFALASALALLGLLAALCLAERCFQAGVSNCLSPNEGWNAFFTAAAAEGQPLYPPPDRLVTNNYPPLSFLLMAALGPLFHGDYLLTGRIVSLAAVLALAAAVAGITGLLGGGRPGMAAGGILFLATLCRFYDYAGQNDPQLAAQALMAAAAWWFLRREETGRSLAAPVALMVAAGFLKHNIVALPAATLGWLLIRDPRRAAGPAATGLLLAAAGLAACLLIYGRNFLYNFTTPRGFFLSQGAEALPDLLRHVALPASVTLAAGWAWRREGAFPCLLLGLSLASFFLQSCGDGVGPNAEFDAVIASCLGFGLAVGLLGRSPRPAGPAIAALLVFSATATLLPPPGSVATRLLTDRAGILRDKARTEAAMAEAVALCRAMPGDVYCDPTVLYRAGKPFVVDSYNTAERRRYGRLPGDPVALLYRQGSLSFVEVPYDYLNASWYPY